MFALYLLHPHLLSGGSVLATLETREDVPVPVCFGVHSVQNFFKNPRLKTVKQIEIKS